MSFDTKSPRCNYPAVDASHVLAAVTVISLEFDVSDANNKVLSGSTYYEHLTWLRPRCWVLRGRNGTQCVLNPHSLKIIVEVVYWSIVKGDYPKMLKPLVLTALVAGVSAHQNFHQFWVNDVSPGYQVGIRMPPSNNPVTEQAARASKPSPRKQATRSKCSGTAPRTPAPSRTCYTGPSTARAAASGIGAGWFKIDEEDYVDGKWANEIMEADDMTRTFKLPANLETGEYLLRSEMLALHGAQTLGGAQLSITGPGGDCSPKISLPGTYQEDDVDIYIPNFYNGFDPTTYNAPGGDVATCS
ncbi:hypothetical protein CHU98_g11712 [Xylaria longipes]|nr:hypothetical protein CHU98_g11712 [Xylaria longipes]